MAADAAASATTLAERQRQASQRLRDAARYLVVGFGAVAVTLLTGLGLTRLDNLSPQQQVRALAAAGLALLGVIVLLVLSTWLAAASAITAEELVNAKPTWRRRSAAHALSVVTDPTNGLLGGHEKLAGDDATTSLLAAQREAYAQFRAAYADYAEGGELAPLQRRAALVRQLDRHVAVVMSVASHERLRHRFVRSAFGMGGAAAVTAAGVLLFVSATNPAEQPGLVLLPAAPAEATLDVVETMQDPILARLGADCDADPDAIPVLILAIDDDTADVLVDAGPGCARIRLEVTEELGVLVAR